MGGGSQDITLPLSEVLVVIHLLLRDLHSLLARDLIISDPIRRDHFVIQGVYLCLHASLHMYAHTCVRMQVCNQYARI